MEQARSHQKAVCLDHRVRRSRDGQRSDRKGLISHAEGLILTAAENQGWVSAGDFLLRLSFLKDHSGLYVGITKSAHRKPIGRWW